MNDLLKHPQRALFEQELHAEHIDEIGFLLLQRQRYLADPAVGWRRAGDVDLRILAHLGAMREWDRPAFETSRRALGDADEYRAIAAIFLVASLGIEMPDLAAVQALAGEEPDRLPLWVQALPLAVGPDLGDTLGALLDGERLDVAIAAVEILGLRREGRVSRLEAMLQHDEPEMRGAAARALARRGYREAAGAMEVLLADDPATNAAHMVLPLLLLGSTRAANHCRRACAGDQPAFPGLPRLMALGGAASDAPLLQGTIAGASPEEMVQALAILGAPSAAPVLIDRLASKSPSIQLEAALALERIFRSGLREKTMVPVEVDEEDLELSPARPPAREIEVERVSTSRIEWERWWNKHRVDYDGARRYRNGAPFDAAACIDEIAAAQTPLEDRQRAAQELAIHFRQHFPFEPDGMTDGQQAAIASWRAWLKTQST
jgi:HEAT repeat protein